jgi:hypothetical protein
MELVSLTVDGALCEELRNTVTIYDFFTVWLFDSTGVYETELREKNQGNLKSL